LADIGEFYHDGMRPKGTAAELERRRRRAVELVEGGESPSLVARILGVTPTSLHRWRRQARQTEGLAARPAPGAQRRLSDPQLAHLEALLDQGAPAHGYPNQLWTAGRVAGLIEERFGVTYHPEHVRKLLRSRLGWTSQQPQRHARERQDKEVERWKADEFPRLLRQAWQREAHIGFLDESGFLLAPLVRRSLARRGHPPVVDGWDRHDRLSVISCVTLSPQAARAGLYFDVLPDNQNAHGTEVVAFLSWLCAQLPGPWIVVWDRHRIHSRSRVVQAWLARHPRVTVEDFPGYAPDANPDEWVWSWAKYGRLCNLAAADLTELRRYVEDALGDLRHDHRMLARFITQAGVPLIL
jgi:transposase